MKGTAYRGTTAKGVQSFYIRAKGGLFSFSAELPDEQPGLFPEGGRICDPGRYAGAHSASVRKTLDKLPAYIRSSKRNTGSRFTKGRSGRRKGKAEDRNGRGGKDARTERSRCKPAFPENLCGQFFAGIQKPVDIDTGKWYSNKADAGV